MDTSSGEEDEGDREGDSLPSDRRSQRASVVPVHRATQILMSNFKSKTQSSILPILPSTLPHSSPLGPPAPKIATGRGARAAATSAASKSSPAKKFALPTVANMAKFQGNQMTPQTPSSADLDSQSPASDKYRKYRLKQKEKFVDLQGALDDSNREIDRMKAKERKLLYLLLISHRQVTIRDEELTRMALEIEKYRAKLGEDTSSTVPIVQGLISLRESGGGAASPFIPNRKQPSALISGQKNQTAAQQPTTTTTSSTPAVAESSERAQNPQGRGQQNQDGSSSSSSSGQANKRGLGNASDWYGKSAGGGQSFDLGLPPMSDMPNFGDDLLDRVMPEGKEDEMEDAFISSLIYDEMLSEKFRQRAQRLQSQSSLLNQQFQELLQQQQQPKQPEGHMSSLPHSRSRANLESARSQLHDPPGPTASQQKGSERRGSHLTGKQASFEQLVSSAEEILREPQQPAAQEEKMQANYYAKIFKSL